MAINKTRKEKLMRDLVIKTLTNGELSKKHKINISTIERLEHQRLARTAKESLLIQIIS